MLKSRITLNQHDLARIKVAINHYLKYYEPFINDNKPCLTKYNDFKELLNYIVNEFHKNSFY